MGFLGPRARDGWAPSRVLGGSLGESLGRAGKCRGEAQKRANVDLRDVLGQTSDCKVWIPCAGKEGPGHKDMGIFLAGSAAPSLTSFMLIVIWLVRLFPRLLKS